MHMLGSYIVPTSTLNIYPLVATSRSSSMWKQLSIFSRENTYSVVILLECRGGLPHINSTRCNTPLQEKQKAAKGSITGRIKCGAMVCKYNSNFCNNNYSQERLAHNASKCFARIRMNKGLLRLHSTAVIGRYTV